MNDAAHGYLLVNEQFRPRDRGESPCMIFQVEMTDEIRQSVLL
jgi:hypothetical protein